MTKYESRLVAPTTDNKYYNNGSYNPFVYNYGMFQNNGNCTCYAYGRMSELLGKKSNLPTCNAGGWYDRVTGYDKGKTPKLGAIAVWKKKNTTTNSGHVAVVEEIFEDGSFTVSESGWKKFIFRTKKINSNCVYGSAYNFLGFIYCPIEFESQTDAYKIFVHDTQVAIGADPDGIAGSETLSKTPTISTGTGWNHKAVRPLQVYLKSLGYDLGKCGVDGKFGKDMKACIKKYQKDQGLSIVDGVVTAKMYTWKKLLKLD